MQRIVSTAKIIISKIVSERRSGEILTGMRGYAFIAVNLM